MKKLRTNLVAMAIGVSSMPVHICGASGDCGRGLYRH